MKSVRVRTYKPNGDADQNYFFRDLREAIPVYVKFRDTPGLPRPTLWLFDKDSGTYIRVHDFQFSDATEENIELYKKERILQNDILLGYYQ